MQWLRPVLVAEIAYAERTNDGILRQASFMSLRQDIDVPRNMLDKWLRAPDFEMNFRESLQKVYSYRKQVLAIFDGLVLNLEIS